MIHQNQMKSRFGGHHVRWAALGLFAAVTACSNAGVAGHPTTSASHEAFGSPAAHAAHEEEAGASALLSPARTEPGPAVIRATASAPMYPEGIAYDASSDSFLVGSVRAGTIGRIDAGGTYSVFADAPELVSSAGIFVDRARNRVLAAVGDVGVAVRSTPSNKNRIARVVEFDLTTKKLLRVTDLQALPGIGKDERHLANDLTVDSAGNVYVTDSFTPVIYRIDLQGQASIFARSPLFAPPAHETPGAPNLNGIVAHRDGYLLVGHWSRGQIIKVPLDNPGRAHVIAEGLGGADGLVLKSDGELVVVRNYPGDHGAVTGSAVLLTSSDHWETSHVKTRGGGQDVSVPTTAAIRGDDVYAVNFPYDEFFPNPTTASRREIVISRIQFDGPEKSRVVAKVPAKAGR